MMTAEDDLAATLAHWGRVRSEQGRAADDWEPMAGDEDAAFFALLPPALQRQLRGVARSVVDVCRAVQIEVDKAPVVEVEVTVRSRAGNLQSTRGSAKQIISARDLQQTVSGLSVQALERYEADGAVRRQENGRG